VWPFGRSHADGDAARGRETDIDAAAAQYDARARDHFSRRTPLSAHLQKVVYPALADIAPALRIDHSAQRSSCDEDSRADDCPEIALRLWDGATFHGPPVFIQVHTDWGLSDYAEEILSKYTAFRSMKIDRLLVSKSGHSLDLMSDGMAVRRYQAHIGPGGAGPKHKEGDNITPVGRYHLGKKQDKPYHTFWPLDYPNPEDHARFDKAKAAHELGPEDKIGGEIGLHGTGETYKGLTNDWTAGCIAVTDEEIDEISRLVHQGTIIDVVD
jgi:hypothetical protein